MSAGAVVAGAVLSVLLVVALLVAVGFWQLWRHECEVSRMAHERLLAAWKDGHIIPPPEAVALPTSDEPPEPLPPELQALVDEWESGDARLIRETQVRNMLSMGWSPVRILGHFEEQKFRSAGQFAPPAPLR